MNDKLLAGVVARLALSEPTDHRGPLNKRPFVEHPIGRERTNMNLIAVTCGYARVSKADDESKNPGT